MRFPRGPNPFSHQILSPMAGGPGNIWLWTAGVLIVGAFFLRDPVKKRRSFTCRCRSGREGEKKLDFKPANSPLVLRKTTDGRTQRREKLWISIWSSGPGRYLRVELICSRIIPYSKRRFRFTVGYVFPFIRELFPGVSPALLCRDFISRKIFGLRFDQTWKEEADLGKRRYAGLVRARFRRKDG